MRTRVISSRAEKGYLSHPAPPKDLREALIKFEQMANWPEIIGCPFLRIASEFPDTAHPYHRRAIEHQDKILDYLTDLLSPFPIDKRAAATAILSIIDGALSLRMLYGNSKEIPIVSLAEAVLKSFQSAQQNTAGDRLSLGTHRSISQERRSIS